jgi:hypothetical protein
MPAKPNLTLRAVGMLATYWCPGCFAQERGLAHGVHCPENRTRLPPAAANGQQRPPLVSLEGVLSGKCRTLVECRANRPDWRCVAAAEPA